MAQGKPVGTIFAELDLDTTRYTRAQQTLLRDATTTTLNIEQNFKNLGIKSSAEMDLMRQKVMNSYNAIANSARATANDIIRAEEAKNSKLKALDEMQFGRQTSMMASLKNNYLAVSASIAATIYTLERVSRPFVAVFEKGFQAVETYSQSVAALAANVVTFSERAKGQDLAGQWQDALKYSTAMVPILENIAAKTLLSGQQTTALAEALSRSGVFLNANNAAQVEGFTRLSNALPLMTKGQEIMRQINTEIRALMTGQGEASSMLLITLKAIDPQIEKHLKTWRAEDKVLEHIGELLVGYGPATAMLENQWQAVKSTIDTTATQILRGIMKPAYEEINSEAKKLNDWMSQNKQFGKGFGEDLAKSIHFVAENIETLGKVTVNVSEILIGRYVVSCVAARIQTASLAVAAESAAAGIAATGASAGVARIAISALGGPIGIITGLLTAGAVAWAVYGDEIKKAVDEANRARNIANFGPGAIPVTGGPGTFKSTTFSISDADRLRAEKFMADLKQGPIPSPPPGGKGGDPAASAAATDKAKKAAEEYARTIGSLTNELALNNPMLTDHEKSLLKLEQKYDALTAKYPAHRKEIESLRETERAYLSITESLSRTKAEQAEAEKEQTKFINDRNRAMSNTIELLEIQGRLAEAAKLRFQQERSSKEYQDLFPDEQATVDRLYRMEIFRRSQQERGRVSGVRSDIAGIRADTPNIFGFTDQSKQDEAELERQRKRLQDELDLEAEFNGKKTELYQALTDKKMALEELYSARAKASQLENFNMAVGGMSNMLGQMAGMLDAHNKKQFAMQKALNIAQAIMNTYEGATKALSQGGAFGGFMAAMVVAQGMMQVAQIAAQKYQGRQYGGPVSAGSTYRVNEEGPEMLSVSGRDYLMMGSQPGYVTPAYKMNKGSGGGVVVNIRNTIPNATFDVRPLSATEVEIIAKREARAAVNEHAPKVIANEFGDANSRVSKAASRNIQAPRVR